MGPDAATPVVGGGDGGPGADTVDSGADTGLEGGADGSPIQPEAGDASPDAGLDATID